MGAATCLIPQLQQSSIWLFLKISQDNVFGIDYINLQLAFSGGLVNPESAILCHRVLQKVWKDEEFLLLEKQCIFSYYILIYTIICNYIHNECYKEMPVWSTFFCGYYSYIFFENQPSMV